MAVLEERIETSLDIEDAFDFVADFANSAQWDPGVATSKALDDGGLRLGARYLLGVRMGSRVAPMTYTITRLDRPHRVVLAGEGSGVAAVDDISFARTASGTTIDYVADIRLKGVLRLLAPFAGGSFRRIADNARTGMQRTLDARSAARGN
ncbi:MAG: SRPBCC family protein [Chloroflexi bacterium]|nr:SRPBCC family protein [Chloroflexota bacterium]